jgi:hypothetical protein
MAWESAWSPNTIWGILSGFVRGDGPDCRSTL